MSKVASGGELSRLMLAIKSLIAQYTALPTIIFDEIDAGVSGEVANKVGQIMERLCRKPAGDYHYPPAANSQQRAKPLFCL